MRQLFAYAAIGIATNAIGYAIYLLITWLWLEPKVAMTLLYVVGATLSYFGNKEITFAATDGVLASGARFLVAHALGYAINLALLMIFVDRMGFPHQFVQAISIFVVAAYLFVALKFFVFRAKALATDDPHGLTR